MANRIAWDGLDVLTAALRMLPVHLRDEATTIIHATATGAMEEIKAAYPHGPTGNLKRGVKVTVRASGSAPGGDITPGMGVEFGAAGIVKNSAKHAWLFEYGTQGRIRYVDTLPSGRVKNFGWSRGAMPPGRVFIPIVVRRRREMYADLSDVVRKLGFEVAGRAG